MGVHCGFPAASPLAAVGVVEHGRALLGGLHGGFGQGALGYLGQLAKERLLHCLALLDKAVEHAQPALAKRSGCG